MAAAAALYGGITVGGRYFAEAGLSLLEISLTGVLFGAILQAPLLACAGGFRRRGRAATARSAQIGFFAAFGGAGAALQLSQFAGIVAGVPVAVVALLLYTQPLWTVLLGRWLFGEALSGRKLLAAGLAVLGAGLLALPELRVGGSSPWGLAAALAAGLFLSAWVLFGRASALRGNPPVLTSFGYMAGTAAWLLAAAPVLHGSAPTSALWRLRPSLWAAHLPAVAVYTLGANLLPAWLAMWGLRHVQASRAGVLLLFEPVAAALLAACWFGEPLDGWLAAGGALILLANTIRSREPRGGDDDGGDRFGPDRSRTTEPSARRSGGSDRP